MKASDVLRIARSYLGEGEEPRGSNWSKPDGVVVRSLACVGIDKPAPWCAAFICLVISEAAPDVSTASWLPGWMKKSASGIRLRDQNKHLIVPNDQARPGDIYIIDHGKGLSHVGFVLSRLRTVENGVPGALMMHFRDVSGNTNYDGSRAGYEVASNLRSLDDPNMTILRPPYEEENQ